MIDCQQPTNMIHYQQPLRFPKSLSAHLKDNQLKFDKAALRMQCIPTRL